MKWGWDPPPLFYSGQGERRRSATLPGGWPHGPPASGATEEARQVRGFPDVESQLEARVEALAMELVDYEWGGNERRPILRIRVDYPDSEPGAGVTVNDCARVSRALETWLDGHPGLPERYVLEVSSPGVERPLRRHRDWVRFTGHEVAVRGKRPLADDRRRLQGEILGVGGPSEEFGESGMDPSDFPIRVRTDDGKDLEFRHSEVEEAHLVFRWE